MNLLAGELLTYVFKYIVLGAIAIIGVVCGAKYKKNKLAPKSEFIEDTNVEE